MGSCEDSRVIEEEPASSDVVLSEEVAHEQLMCSVAVREDKSETVGGQRCTRITQLIEENGRGGDSDVGDFLVNKSVDNKDVKIKATFMGTEETHAEKFESLDGEMKASGVDPLSGVSVRLMEHENQNTDIEGSEEGVEVGITVGCDLKGVHRKDAETIRENADDMVGLEMCLAGANVDSFNHLIDGLKGSNKVADEQDNRMHTFESAEITHTLHQAVTICTVPVPWTNQTDHNTDICSVGGVLIGKEGGSNGRETPLTECAISREVTLDDDFFGDINDRAPCPLWKNSTGNFCVNVSSASVEENTSNEISFTRNGKASCDPQNVPMHSGVVYDAPFEKISEYHEHSRFCCHDCFSPYDSEDNCLVSEQRSIEETEVTEEPEGVSPCRPYPADDNSSCAKLKGLLKTSHSCRSGRKTQAKRAARNSLNPNKELHSFVAPSFDDKAVKKKRTYTSKAARAYVWGALNNISQLFEQTKGSEFVPFKSQKYKKSRFEKANKKKQKSSNGTVDLSKKKSASSISRIRLKVKLGKEIIGSGLNMGVVESNLPTSFVGTVREEGESTVTKELCSPQNNTGKQHECFNLEGYKVNISDGPYQASSQSSELLEKNLYFNKTEISNYAKDEAVSDRFVDPETSPDSEVINMVPEVQGVERSRECVSVSDLSHQSLQTQQDGSLIMQKTNESIAGLETGLGTPSLENHEYLLYKRRICKANSRPAKSAESRECNGYRKSGDQSRKKGKNKDVKLIEFTRDSSMKTGVGSVDGDWEECTVGANSEAEYAAVISLERTNNLLSSQLVEQHSPRNAWVRCDDCLKWRRISVALADSIEDTNSSWTCKENLDKNFADCSVPQEKSNTEINAELEISDASGEEDENDVQRNYKQLEFSRPAVLQQSSFVHIGSNKFTNRSRRTQSIDEVMVCHCKPSLDGRLGCGDECLNRMLNIECVQGTCPCGDLCSNQQFQHRKYANMQWFRCGKKGFGLQLLEDVRKGTFIIEYVGEVLDMPTYEGRQRDYAAKGHKHFYFMTLNGSEVIDASARGNLGRFINHSCDPNCRTEKWMVNGEICIGLFAIRNIKKGEELTFDYNYVRVFGAAVKKCVCGSRHCRGYIGGDPLNSEVIVQGDSDDEFSEPVMLTDGDTLDNLDNATTYPCSLDLTFGLNGSKGRHEVKGTQICTGSEEAVHQFYLYQTERSVDVAETEERVESSSLPTGIALDLEFTAGSVVSDSQKPISLDPDVSQMPEKTDLSSPRTSKGKVSDDTSKGLKSDKSDEGHNSVKLHTLVKMSKFAKAINKGKENNVLPISNKVQGVGDKSLLTKSRRIIEASSCGRFEAVEEKLNELLDADGGISKRKDAAKGYLKLLFLTAASGDCVNGGAIQSNRDLSMILDAVLKTRSRVVLIDILCKNGLQMLHNTLKLYRRDFKKIPILRKLLKVLEFLASREILTLEHISSGPPYPGMESFRESILSLTEHDDKQVHQIARNFRDKYIPKSIRKTCQPDRAPAVLNNRHLPDIRPTEAIDCLSQSISSSVTTPIGSLLQNGTASSIDSSSVSGRRVGKRKSRWDQPGDTVPDPVSDVDKKENCSVDIPMEFPPCVDISRVLSHTSSTMAEVLHGTVRTSQGPFHQAVGQLEERFNSLLPVSYGIPLYILQNLGKPQAEAEGWVIAPGMPFHPFPPLPQYPRDKKHQSLSPGDDSLTKDISAERKQQDEYRTASFIDESCPSTTANDGSDENTNSDNQPSVKRLRASPQDLSRNYFKQQKWNTTQVGPHWLWRRKCWGFSVRGGSRSSGIRNVVNGNENSSFAKN